MIRGSRKRHRIIWLVLAVLLPVLFAAGLLLRHEDPVNIEIPKVERTSAPQEASTQNE
ncbi:MAG: hypothetical protein HKN33_14655 [Pyrinomonadaceae bacterium]|nr:hypothetical protein [Pyrinomonadaceae bacterium]